MRRGLWFAAGAGLGVYAMVRGRRVAEAFTADGLHDRWEALGLGARLFRDEVATGKAEAESRLRVRFGPTYDPTPQLGSGPDTPSGLDTPSLVPREGYSTTGGREGYSTTGTRDSTSDGHDEHDDSDIRNDFEEGPQ